MGALLLTLMVVHIVTLLGHMRYFIISSEETKKIKTIISDIIQTMIPIISQRLLLRKIRNGKTWKEWLNHEVKF